MIGRARGRLHLHSLRPRDLLSRWIGGLGNTPARRRLLAAALLSVVAAGIYPPIFGPGSGPIQLLLTAEPDALGMVALAGLALGVAVTLGAGAVGDLTDRRRWMLIGLVGLLAGCGYGFVGGDVDALGIAFVLATVSSGVVLPVALGRIRAEYEGEPGTQSTAIALGFAALGLAQTVAPAIMDTAADLVGDAWAFLLPLALSTFAIGLVTRWVPREPRTRAPSGRGVVIGILTAICLLGLATSVILLALGSGGLAAILLIAAVGAAMGAVVRWRARTGRAVVEPGTFRLRPVSAAVAAGFLLALGQAGPMMSFGVFVEAIQGYTSIEAALALWPYALAIVVLGLAGPALIPRLGVRGIVAASLLAIAAGDVILAFTAADSSHLFFVLPLFLLGGGLIVGTAATAAVITAGTPGRLAASAIAIQIASLDMGALLGMGIQAVILTAGASAAYETSLVARGIPADVIASVLVTFREALLEVAPGIARQTPTTEIESLLPGFREAYAAGFGTAALVAAAICAAGAPIAYVFFGTRTPEGVEAVLSAASSSVDRPPRNEASSAPPPA